MIQHFTFFSLLILISTNQAQANASYNASGTIGEMLSDELERQMDTSIKGPLPEAIILENTPASTKTSDPLQTKEFWYQE